MKRLVLTFALALCAFAAQGESLFNGKNLSGWERRGGKATFRVEDGAIVGICTPGAENTFLCTKASYGDFVLEMKFRVDDERINSGVQFRSHADKNYREGKIYGYQYEIDPSGGGVGGVYDEERSGWLYELNPGAKSAYVREQWNTMRIAAVGNEIRTWINGREASDFVADYDSEGFIGLQVHAIGDNKALSGKKIMWKDIVITEVADGKMEDGAVSGIPQVNLMDNHLSERERIGGWKLLWDGKTTNGWRGARLDAFPGHGWKVDGGELIVLKGGGGESTNGGDIVTTRLYGNFELLVDFYITEGANSGIKYFVQPDLNRGEGSAIGCEFQVLDDLRHPDAKLGVRGNRTLGSLYDLIAAPEDKPFVWGKFNRARIIVDGNHVEHWLNGVKLLEYERNNDMWKALVNYSKYVDWPNFGNWAEGHILLQDHGDEVHFKNIKIREF